MLFYQRQGAVKTLMDMSFSPLNVLYFSKFVFIKLPSKKKLRGQINNTKPIPSNMLLNFQMIF